LNTPWRRAANFSPLSRSRLGSRIATHLRRLIQAGEMPAGSRLPSLRALAAMTAVSVPTIREGVAELVALGLVVVRPGVGTFVARRNGDERRLLTVELRHATPRELAEIRAMIEREAAPRAAERRATTHRDLRTFDEIRLRLMEFGRAKFSWPEIWTDADAALHIAIVAAAMDARSGGAYAARVHAATMRRLRPAIIHAAPDLAGDQWVERCHTDLAYAVLDGQAELAAQYASLVVRYEMAALR
jgi:DNA-binding FadR family transcriptional regulator